MSHMSYYQYPHHWLWARDYKDKHKLFMHGSKKHNQNRVSIKYGKRKSGKVDGVSQCYIFNYINDRTPLFGPHFIISQQNSISPSNGEWGTHVIVVSMADFFQ